MILESDQDTFEEDMGVTYSVTLSNGVQQELVTGGAKKKVAYKDR